MTTSSVHSELEMLTALLRHFEWAPRSRTSNLYEVWGSGGDEEEEVLVPLDPQRGDFDMLLQRARRSVISQYGVAARRLWETLEMQTRAFLDVTQWKKQTALEAGIIGWEQGEAQYAAARAQLIASAKSSREPRRYHGNASSYIAKRFLENSFMGQTDIGSFIITAYTPSSQRFYLSRSAEERHAAEPPMWETESISGRDILGTFEHALKAVREGLNDYKKRPQAELFLDMVADGVSYEFTRALSEMIAGGDAAVEIRRQGLGEEQSSSGEVAFDAAEAPVLDKVANLFVAESEPQNVTLVGEVTLLSRSSDEPHRVIRLNIASGADIRKTRVRLSDEQYRLAMEAHREEAALRVTGRLEKEGNQYWLYNAEDVTVVPEQPDEPVRNTTRRMEAKGARGSRPEIEQPTIFDESGE